MSYEVHDRLEKCEMRRRNIRSMSMSAPLTLLVAMAYGRINTGNQVQDARLLFDLYLY